MNYLRLSARLAAVALSAVSALLATETKTLPLSGLGEPGEKPVFWDFKIDNGRRSGEWTTIRVPSCWETEGFGTFYYGIQGRGKPDTDPIIPKEQGTYRTKFTVPADWMGSAIRIVFEAAMTDTTVTINGQPAGPTHQGGFYRFHYDITSLVKIGAENTLEVLVAKESSNTSVNRAERRGDYWTFGGIYRPVWLEARPQQHIEWTAIDARADGSFSAHVHLGAPLPEKDISYVIAEVIDANDRPVGERLTARFDAGRQTAIIRGKFENPKTWTAETPHLYRVRFMFARASDGHSSNPERSRAFTGIDHTVTERFGFRTFEVRKNDGLYLNGTKIVMKGVNRHCFWPETGRTVTREQSYADARLIKAANMNAVRMAHYPPDRHFLEACDELGLYVLDELAGWQGFYDTPTGARLIGQIVRRDVNHPSILFWDNGNEGGWNTENDGEFAKWDPQNRPVLHPWAVHSDINTDHYEKYASTVKLSAGPQIFMPTEFLHGLYDGGIGAGFRDYWDVMGKSPTVAGGFFWVWSDEGVLRTDQGGRIDNFGNNAPDGMVGPHRELEGSYHAVKEIWSPVQVKLPAKWPKEFDGRVEVENHFNFTNLAECRFEIRWVTFGPWGKKETRESAGPEVKAIVLPSPDVPPGKTGTLVIPAVPQDRLVEALRLTAFDPQGRELWSWVSEINPPDYATVSLEGPAFSVRESIDELTVSVSSRTFTFDRATGLLKSVEIDGKMIPLTGGPRFFALRRKDRTFVDIAPPVMKLKGLTTMHGDDVVGVGVLVSYDEPSLQVEWALTPDGEIHLNYAYLLEGEFDVAGIRFDLADSTLKSKRWLGRGPYRVWQNRQEGGVFDLHEVAFNNPIPGQTYAYPEFKGFFRDWRWLTLETTAGRITVENASDTVPFFALGKIKSGEKDLITDWPDMGLAFLHAIPAIGTKFDFPELLGPQSQPAKLNGVQRGTLIFRFETE
ncbi:glycoside hydrolase family 2 [Nibricoccus aquaticus]|uniref:beta-galactosidase n=1 Tax=Nibricoccus aquaticus TaxID=2576891 RepID=A0A290Q739_9BACT|nr:glycoside hydrolase family 2 TIM barrel-domain containing protein [Nibricoccus aquaticus]ATC64459.1 glycoside hydrolase family 2 [Nibricoccus aquaticus]